MLQSGFIVNLFKEFQVIVRWGNDPVSFCIDKAPLAIDFDAGPVIHEGRHLADLLWENDDVAAIIADDLPCIILHRNQAAGSSARFAVEGSGNDFPILIKDAVFPVLLIGKDRASQVLDLIVREGNEFFAVVHGKDAPVSLVIPADEDACFIDGDDCFVSDVGNECAAPVFPAVAVIIENKDAAARCREDASIRRACNDLAGIIDVTAFDKDGWNRSVFIAPRIPERETDAKTPSAVIAVVMVGTQPVAPAPADSDRDRIAAYDAFFLTSPFLTSARPSSKGKSMS